MKIISWNVNGIRSVYKKGFIDWMEKTNADIICLQEIKAQDSEIQKLFSSSGLFRHSPYYLYSNFAQKKGYSGVAIFTKEKPTTIDNKLGLERFDQEGRLLKLSFKNFILYNLYIPHGGREKENMVYKLQTYDRLFALLSGKQRTILVGDFNVAHTALDLARPKGNQNNTMFTPEEREKLDTLTQKGFVDTFRLKHKEGENYTWWPYAVDARERNIGWRIDYIFVSTDMRSYITDAYILKDTKGSDHCPVGITI